MILCSHGEDPPACRDCLSRRAFLKGATIFTATVLAVPWLVDTDIRRVRFVGQTGRDPNHLPQPMGSFATGDYVVDTNGQLWACVASGSPGRWGRISPASFSYDHAWA